jgi:hypothetical protein
MDFTSFSHNTPRDFTSFSHNPRTFKSLTDMPLAPPLDPTVMASSPAARWGAGRQTSDGELKLSSPVVDWWRWFGRGGRRRAAAAAQGRCGRGSSNGGEGRGNAQQCAAPGASMWPREGARQVTGAEDRRGGESTVAVRRRPRELGLRRSCGSA